MEYRVLGPVEVRRDGQATALSGRLQRVLFGVLLARANQPVPVDALTDALWGDRPDPRTGQKLQCLSEALAVAAEDDHREVQAHAHADIADVHVGLGDHAMAREHRREALGYYENLGLPDGEARLRQRLTYLGDRTTTAGRCWPRRCHR